ncbi:MAG: DUF1588 domain-containing protein [Aureliella sp.]
MNISRRPVLIAFSLAWMSLFCLNGNVWADEAVESSSVVLRSPDPQTISPQPEFSFEQATTLLRVRCGDCHADGAEEGEFALDRVFESENSLKTEYQRWQTIRQRIQEQTMPPADCEQLDASDRTAVVAWIERATLEQLCAGGLSAGPPLLRRLAKHEYSNTIRDLLDVHFDAGQGLPDDTAGGEGFTNAAETLTISPIHAEKYLQAAVDALDYASHNEGTRKKLLSVRPGESKSEEQAARENLRNLAERAFRHPVGTGEIDRFVNLYQSAKQDELSWDEAVLYAMRAILVSPNFLFIAESSPPEPNQAVPLSDHELAVRLSYFLWASSPDDELRRVADEGKLNNDEELKRQTLRLISKRGTHLQDSLEQFIGSWLGTADLGRSKKVDRERHRWVEDPHVAALRNQPVYAMESIMQENESLLTLIDADWTFLNDELARVYKIKKDQVEGEFVQRLNRVKLPETLRYRGGLLGMGGVYVVSSYPSRSSPVLRGAWVLEKMLGVELPAPPPDIPALDESKSAAESQTLRQRFEIHRQDAVCATCHDRIDPIGFALENFDELGVWRDRDEGGTIDPVAVLAGDQVIDGVAGLKAYMMTQKDTFVHVLCRKMLGYALGRSLQPSDLCTVEAIAQRLKDNDYRAQELVLGIVTSDPFRKKMVIEGIDQ